MTTARYVVRDERYGYGKNADLIVYRIYDTLTGAYPAWMPNGIIVQGHYSSKAHARSMVDKLNRGDD